MACATYFTFFEVTRTDQSTSEYSVPVQERGNIQPDIEIRPDLNM